MFFLIFICRDVVWMLVFSLVFMIRLSESGVFSVCSFDNGFCVGVIDVSDRCLIFILSNSEVSCVFVCM